jgi:hypothetical protein
VQDLRESVAKGKTGGGGVAVRKAPLLNKLLRSRHEAWLTTDKKEWGEGAMVKAPSFRQNGSVDGSVAQYAASVPEAAPGEAPKFWLDGGVDGSVMQGAAGAQEDALPGEGLKRAVLPWWKCGLKREAGEPSN